MSRASSKVKLSSKGAKARHGEKKSNTDLLDTAPKKPEVPQLAWKIIPEAAMKKLRGVEDLDKLAKKFAGLLALTESEVCMKEAAQLDYYVAGYWHGLVELKMNDEQLSAFITILHMLLNNLSKGHLLGESMKVLKELMLTVGVPAVPTPLECFTTDLAASVLHYFQSTLFQHYALFQYLFTEEQEEEFFTNKLTLDVPNPEQQLVFPAPLEESIPLELYERCLVEHPQQTESTDGLVIDVPSNDPDTMETIEEHIEGGESGDAITLEEELEISADDLKALIEKHAKSAIQSFQTQMFQKIKEKEEVISNKLSKLEKTLHAHH